VSKTIFTIGHSNHSKEYFLDLLQCHQISVVADVRSIAASRYNPQYNGKQLNEFLNQNNIMYLHLPNAFGARQTNPIVLDENNQVDFEKMRQSTMFKNGIKALMDVYNQNHNIALMCAEADPLTCHRFFMVAVSLVELGFEIKHILKDKTYMLHRELEEELMKKFAKKIQPDMFNPELRKEEALKHIYRLKNKEMGYVHNKQER
jgi:uncharacterized protein (DUF488 family)